MKTRKLLQRTAITLCAVSLLVPFGSSPAQAAPSDYSITGIDVSHWQGTITWSSVASAGIDFAYAKATQGMTETDPQWAANLAAARNTSIKFGAYAFGRPDEGNPRGQADRLVDVGQYKKDGKTLPPMLDIEWPTTGDSCYGLSTSAMVSWISAFVDQVTVRTGQKTVIYTNRNWWDPCTGSTTAFGSYPLFVAAYNNTSPGTLPSGWSKWTLWQYTSSGSVSGVGTDVDRDVFNGTAAQLAALCPNDTPQTKHGSLWDRGRNTSGVWDTNATTADKNPASIATASTALPDGRQLVAVVIPNAGTYVRTRAADGTWASTSEHIDTNGKVTDVAMTTMPDGTVEMSVLVPGAGVYTRTRKTDGTWDASSEQSNTNGSTSAIATASLPNGELHVQVLIPGVGVYDRRRSAAGVWDASTVKMDNNTLTTDIAAAGMPDGTLEVQMAIPGSGIWSRKRGTDGTWATNSVHADVNPNTIGVSSAAGSDGTLYISTLIPNAGVYVRSRDTSGTWAQTSTRADTNGATFKTYLIAEPDGTLHTGQLVAVN
jgi:GH25 family lysozyme M1 (1,4-beta-N-acetylmuramidase)